MTDIKNREDLTLLFQDFYQRLLRYPQMQKVFIDVAQLDLEAHLPVIVSFWETVLLGTGNYRANVMEIHQLLDAKEPLTSALFEIWLQTLYETTDDHFSGEIAELLKTRALSISQVMQIKLNNFG